MPTETNILLDEPAVEKLREIAGPENVLFNDQKVERLSKDFYWYSPVLKRQLDDLQASAAVHIRDLETLKATVAFCARESLPVTVRGAGTGNYGQCIPLYGGVVVDLSGMDKIHSVDGVARVEPGAALGKVEIAARAEGWELRCMPSTWVKSTMGGFLCGGSGGIGSITWGGINHADNIKAITLLTIEETPRLIRLEERDAIKSLHTYGTTGIMVEIEMRLAPKVDYEQLIFSHRDWETLIDWTDSIARDDSIKKRLVTQFEWPIPTYFKPLRRYFVDEEHVTFLLIERSQAEAVIARASEAGISHPYRKELPDPPKPPYLTDYTWNHTTLWALKEDPSLTYLQSGFGKNFKEQMKQLWERFPGEIMFHLEWTSGNSKMGSNDRVVGVGSIPIVRFKTEERLQEIIDYCTEIGVFTANPHTVYLEEGGRHPDIEAKHALKADADPKGILNPGKMKSYPHNPFARAAVVSG